MYRKLCDFCHAGVIKSGKQEERKDRQILGHKSAQTIDDDDDDDDNDDW